MLKAITITIIIILVIVVVAFLLSHWEEHIKAKTTATLTKEFEARIESISESQEILISQIQPHFLYNVLNTIKYLCKRNPDEALIAIDRFSLFLRKSMDAFNSKECIPLLQELEIVENYVYLEKCRFGDKVEVIFDIICDDFKVPSLSIQPMVENAIKHGITKNIGGGTVWINTYEKDESNIVEIRDNGVGFYVDAPNPDDKKSHIGLKNTAKRIETMSHGSFTIKSEPGSQTVVIMKIPKETQ